MLFGLLFIIFTGFQLIYSKDGLNLLVNDVLDEKRDFESLLMDILYNTLKPFKCVAILCDTVYYNSFKETIFKKMGLYISYFIVEIEDADDLLSPYPETQESLITIREQDCQTYIILISNGIQMTRLLQFGTRYRVLDTRANFIILYDTRLFEKEYHYIWKTIINVIFIREYGGVKKVGSERGSIPWFELSTVPFPSPIRGVLIPRRLDIWRQNKFRTGADLFRDKTNDLHNQSLKVVTFQHMPAAVKTMIPEFKTAKTVLVANSQGFTGIEVEILATVSKAMNFFPELYEPEKVDTQMWGYKRPDGHFSGLFGELINSRADIGLGDFYYTSYILDIMDLTIPYNTECLSFLTPESLTDNSWKTLLLPFKPMMWIGLIICISFCSISFYYLARFHKFISEMELGGKERPMSKIVSKSLPLITFDQLNKDQKFDKYTFMKTQLEFKPKLEGEPEGLYLFAEKTNSFIYTFSMLVMVSLPKLPTGWSLRMLTGCYWVYCMLVVTAYKASMTSILANPAPRVTIDTIDQLVDSNLELGSWSQINRLFFKTSLDAASQKIGDRFEITNSTESAVDRVALGKFAFFENIYYLKEAAVKREMRMEFMQTHPENFTNRDLSSDKGSRNLHIMDNCVIKMPISIGMQKNSPIKPRVDKFVRRVIEAGLIKKWLDDVMQSTLNADVTEAGDGVIVLMNARKFIGSVVVLAIGCFISICTFICEIIHFHYVLKKHPDFNKYTKIIIIKDGKKEDSN